MLSAKGLKVQINFLVRELMLAPCEEDCQKVQGYLERLREELYCRADSVQLGLHFVRQEEAGQILDGTAGQEEKQHRRR